AELRRRIWARTGNGAPLAVVTGRANAAASVTIPRMPVHATSITWDQGGIGSRARNAGLTSLGSTAANGTHPKRTPMAVALTKAPAIRSDPNRPEGTAS